MATTTPAKLGRISRTHYASQLTREDIGFEVVVAGWIEDFRDIGKLGFIMLRDVTGLVQTVLKGEILLKARNIPRQSNVMIAGKVQETKAKNFAVELSVNEITILSEASLTLPIDPTGRVESNLDTRLDSRALDLRNPKVLDIFVLRSGILRIIRDFFSENNFIEVNTPKIIGSASEGGSNLFSFDYFRRKGYLAQSPQLYKEQLVLSLDRVFEIAPYFRAENSHTLRHLNEFYSVDMEAAYLDYTAVMDLVEDLVKRLIVFTKESKRVNVKNPILEPKTFEDLTQKQFPRIRYEDCINELQNLGEEVEFGQDLSDASLKKLGEKFSNFFFIVDWPLDLKPFYIHEKEDDPKMSKSFDLQFGYLELVSGGTRQHDVTKLKSRLELQGLSHESFKDHLRVFEWGMPPHSGCGLGLDRLMMVLSGVNNIRETVLYPRDTTRISP
ncbi:aspartate--tRNA(Asn) ligase [Candidatus Nitrosocosmicus franklandus]|uniref:Aspartate--tRNA(Asp) ligase n=1 Tax=Candidatus Nitrosocosmicus franklandianus TaxID=1798806 RepID=A0A484IAZ2_9ARCH|nr:aspartate--tRNA(Asn) ligase [Candidatus Nitrosocosmicus franklandus]VFJ12849.1 Aspartate--tRNA(Asp/Asn) ligase [Candidatus Nitrosocosmicus franklandus]